jgi:hypothetical protein
MFNKIIEAKNDSKALLFKNYMPTKISWENILMFIYKESIKENQDLIKKVKNVNNSKILDCIGNVQLQDNFWLAPQSHNLFDEFPQASELLYILNNKKSNSDCSYYYEKGHDCELPWHFQGIRISLSNRLVSDHHDPHDVFYWQIVGTSYWKVDKDITYTLEPGDLLYLPKECSHEVWCDGPRAGLLIDNLI